MRKIVIVFCICVCCDIYSQNKSAEAFLNFEFKEYIDIYDAPKGSVQTKLKNGMYDGDDILIFRLIESNDSMFHVTVFYNNEKDSVIGWIKKNSSIGIYSRAYCTPLKLYIRPNIKSKLWSIMYSYCPYMFVVTDIKDGWLKVRIEYDNQIYQIGRASCRERVLRLV